MTYLVVLVGLLIALAGVIAYTGDVLGTLVGKRRLSLFGARPKQSGRIIGVIAGILIMLVTLATLALSFRNAVQVIMRAQPVAEQLAEQQARLRRSTAQVETLQQQVDARTQELAQAQTEVETAEKARDEARADIAKLQETQAALQGNVKTLNGQVTNLDKALASAQEKVGVAEGKLAEAQAQRAAAEQARRQAVTEAAQANEEAASVRQEAASLTRDVEVARAQLAGVQTELEASRQGLEAARIDLKNAQNELAQADSARDQALEAQAEAEALATKLQENIDGLKTKAEELSTQNTQLSNQNSELSGQNKELKEESDALVQTNLALLDLNKRLGKETKALSEQLQGLQTTNEVLMQDLEQQTSELTRVKDEAASVSSRNISYDINQVVHSGVIAAQEPTLIRVQLAQLVAVARENVVLRGGLDVTLTPEQTESIVQEAAQTPGEDIVVLRSKMNQYVSAPVEVAVEVAPNQKLLEDAQLVVSRQIFLGPGSRDNVRDDLIKVLADANAKLLGLGLSDEVYPSLSETSLEVEGFTNQLLRLKGPVTVGLQASAPIFAGGPAKLEFVIVN